MLELNTGGDALQILWIAAVVGAVSGLTAELLIARGKSKDTGAFELPGGLGSRLVDLGSIAAIPIGCVAAVVAAFLFTPGQEHVAKGVVVQDVELGQLILIAAVAGLASAGFLTLIQERFLAAAKAAKQQSAIDVANTGLDQVKEKAKGSHATKEGKRGAKRARSRVHAAIAEAQGQTPAEVQRVLEEQKLLQDGHTVQVAEIPPITIRPEWGLPQISAQTDEIVDSVATEAVDAVGDQIANQVDAIKAAVAAAQPE